MILVHLREMCKDIKYSCSSFFYWEYIQRENQSRVTISGRKKNEPPAVEHEIFTEPETRNSPTSVSLCPSLTPS